LDDNLRETHQKPQELGFAECDVEEYLEKYLGNTHRIHVWYMW
jgi:hypothetical protein